jgi:hypothetical protein
MVTLKTALIGPIVALGALLAEREYREENLRPRGGLGSSGNDLVVDVREGK